MPTGTYNLNGEQALAYARIRKIDTDYKRTERMRDVLTAIFNKAKNIGNNINNKNYHNIDNNINNISNCTDNTLITEMDEDKDIISPKNFYIFSGFKIKIMHKE